MLSTLAILSILSLPSLPVSVARITPSGNYTPTYTSCPAGHTFNRPASDGLSWQETNWLKTRKCNVAWSLKEFLCQVEIPGFDSEAYWWAIKDDQWNIPTLALTFSGGGERAFLAGMGIYQGLDGRYPPAVEAGSGGLLQAMTYIAGLSGGSIGATAIAINEFPTLQSLINAGNLNQTVSEEAYNELGGKGELGFPVTFTDALAIAEGYNVLRDINDPTVDSLAWTFSGIAAQEMFYNGSSPMPILMIQEVVPYGPGSNYFNSPNGTILLPAPNSTTIFEINPWEFGSWTGRIQAFTDLHFWGTTLQNGQPVNDTCVEGYDSAAFCMGNSLSASNLWLAESLSNGTVGQFARRSTPEQKKSTLSKRFIPYPPDEATREQLRVEAATADLVAQLPEIAELFQSNVTDIIYSVVPNSFANYTEVDPYAAAQEYLFLVDGSEAGQLNPVWPLLQPSRHVDFMIVSDNGGTELSSGWMNGTSLVNTYYAAMSEGLPFPQIPDVNTILNLNLTSKPTFFGCWEPEVPLVLYVADFPYSAYTNISFTASGFNTEQFEILTTNGLYAISQDSGNLAPNWAQCLGCASIQRSLERMNWDIPDVCNQCWNDYCWDGTVDDSSPSFLEPFLVLNQTLGFEEWNSTVFF